RRDAESVKTDGERGLQGGGNSGGRRRAGRQDRGKRILPVSAFKHRLGELLCNERHALGALDDPPGQLAAEPVVAAQAPRQCRAAMPSRLRRTVSAACKVAGIPAAGAELVARIAASGSSRLALSSTALASSSATSGTPSAHSTTRPASSPPSPSSPPRLRASAVPAASSSGAS